MPVTPCTPSITTSLCSTLNATSNHNGSICRVAVHCELISAYLIPSSVPFEQCKGMANILEWSWTVAIPSFRFLFLAFFENYCCSFVHTMYVRLFSPGRLNGILNFFFSFLTAQYCIVLHSLRSYLLVLLINVSILSLPVQLAYYPLWPFPKYIYIYMLCLDCTDSGSYEDTGSVILYILQWKPLTRAVEKIYLMNSYSGLQHLNRKYPGPNVQGIF